MADVGGRLRSNRVVKTRGSYWPGLQVCARGAGQIFSQLRESLCGTWRSEHRGIAAVANVCGGSLDEWLSAVTAGDALIGDVTEVELRGRCDGGCSSVGVSFQCGKGGECCASVPGARRA